MLIKAMMAKEYWLTFHEDTKCIYIYTYDLLLFSITSKETYQESEHKFQMAIVQNELQSQLELYEMG